MIDCKEADHLLGGVAKRAAGMQMRYAMMSQSNRRDAWTPNETFQAEFSVGEELTLVLNMGF